MQSASVYSVTTNFALAVDSVRTPNDMSPLMKADRSFFQLTTPAPHRYVVNRLSYQYEVVLIIRFRFNELKKFQHFLLLNNLLH